MAHPKKVVWEESANLGHPNTQFLIGLSKTVYALHNYIMHTQFLIGLPKIVYALHNAYTVFDWTFFLLSKTVNAPMNSSLIYTIGS